MNRPEDDFGVTVRRDPPPASSVLAPERVLGSGRYAGERRRSKERDQQEPDGPNRARPRDGARRIVRTAGRARSLVVAGGAAVAVVAAGAVGVMALGGGDDEAPRGAASATTTATAGSTPFETVAALVTVDAAASTAAPPTSAATTATTSLGTTSSTPAAALPFVTSVPTVPATPENVTAYESWSGTYDMSGSVIDGNPSFPVGTVSSFELRFAGTCATTCALSSPQFADQPWVVSGDVLSTTYDQAETCPDGGGTATTRVTARFDVSARDATDRPVIATGEVTLETIDAATACPNVESDPVTYNYTMTRRG